MIQLILQELIKHYLGLESFEVTEELLELCGATLDARALPLLKRRLSEEEAQILTLERRGYIRMREKSEQIVASLKALITALGECGDDIPIQPTEAEHRGIAQ
jgi:hypothetical protein